MMIAVTWSLCEISLYMESVRIIYSLFVEWHMSLIYLMVDCMVSGESLEWLMPLVTDLHTKNG
ncbi:hypothetical protein PMI42_02800 [Bradyrhizobium sp. YR681]|nr:hypothetical protein PMI42_02800 [Bradyrhizobium sp. YR681]